MVSRVSIPALVLVYLALQPRTGVNPLFADGPIKVGEDRRLDIGATGLATVEPYLAADPQNAAHLVAGVSLVERLADPRRPPPTPNTFTCATLASFDGGRTWQRHDFAMPQCLDPWTAVLPDGSAVFQGLGRELVAFRSADGGRTWSNTPVSFGRGFDHGTLAVDATQGARRGSVYAVAHKRVTDREGLTRDAVFVARSSDGGATFGEPTHVVSSNLTAFTMNPVVLASGALAVPFVNFAHSLAGGGVQLFDRAPSWLLTSGDGGQTFSAPRFVTDLCARGFPELAASGSEGPYRDRLYYVCHDREGEHVYLHHSMDLGETWSSPVVVNGTAGREPYVHNVAVAVNRHGVVGVSWYDARNDPRGYRGTFRCQELFFAASLDGGQTFVPEVKISSDENCPDTPPNGEAGRRWPAGGDYHGLAATADGQFHLLWPDSRTGIYQLRTATVSVDTAR